MAAGSRQLLKKTDVQRRRAGRDRWPVQAELTGLGIQTFIRISSVLIIVGVVELVSLRWVTSLGIWSFCIRGGIFHQPRNSDLLAALVFTTSGGSDNIGRSAKAGN